MKIMYLGIAVWPSWEVAKQKMWIWLKSVERFGYDFKYYGVGTTQFPGYRGQKIESQLDYLKVNGWGDYTHIFYTDCADCLMLAPPEEIEAKYRALGCPEMLVSSASTLGNVSDPNQYPYFNTLTGKYRYPQVGGYLMEAGVLFWFLNKIHLEYPDLGDECFAWYDGFQKGWFRPVIDSGCEFWQVRDTEDCDIVPVRGIKRLHNRVTDAYPCIYHNAGGFASQDTFKDYDMIPWGVKMGVLKEGEVRP